MFERPHTSGSREVRWLGALAGTAILGVFSGLTLAAPTPTAHPAVSQPGYLTTWAKRHLAEADLTSDIRQPLTLGSFALLLDTATHLTGRPAVPYPSQDTGTGPQARALALAIQAGLLPNSEPTAPSTWATVEAAVGRAIGIDTYGPASSATAQGALAAMDLLPPGPGRLEPTVGQGVAYLARVFATDPAVRSLLVRMAGASSGLNTMVATVSLSEEMVPRPSSASGSSLSNPTSAPPAPGGAMTISGTVRVEDTLRPTPALETQTVLTLRMAGHSQTMREIEIFTAQGGYLETFKGASGTWYRLPSSLVPNLPSMLKGEMHLLPLELRSYLLLHPRLVPGSPGVIRIAVAARLSSFTTLLRALPPSYKSELGATPLDQMSAPGENVELSGLTLYDRRTLLPKAAFLNMAISLPPTLNGQSVPFSGIEMAIEVLPRFNAPITITVPPAAVNAPDLPTTPPGGSSGTGTTSGAGGSGATAG